MKHAFLVAVALAGVVAGAEVHAADAQSAPAVNKHLMAGCMTRHMSASKTMSYNDAKKVCAAQLKTPAEGAPHPLTAAR